MPWMPKLSHRTNLRIAIVLLGLSVWAVAATLLLLDAKRSADDGIEILRTTQREVTSTDLLRGEGRDAFVDAQHEFEQAQSSASNPMLFPLKWLPVIGRQVRSVEALASAASDTLDVGIRALDDTSDVIDKTGTKGPARVALAARLGSIAASASIELDSVDLGPDKHLFGPLQRAHDHMREEYDNIRDAMEGLSAAGIGLSEFLGGPSRYLVFAANNSEMRMGSGAFLSVGVLEVEDGSFSLGKMESTEDLAVPRGAVEFADADFKARWQFAEPTEDFREVATTTRFDVVAPHALAMWEELRGEKLDGVLVIDPIALESLLKVTGSVKVEGKEYSEANVVHEIFLEQYKELEGQGQSEQIHRRDRLSKIARAAIDALETRDWDAVDLLQALRPTVAGRHFLAFSGHDLQQRGWIGAGISGITEPDSITFGLQNRGGNKLDQFVVAEARINAGRIHGLSRNMTIDVTLTNLAPLELPRYVEGPYPTTPRAAAGKYQGWLTFELPKTARNNFIEVDGVAVPLVAAGSDGPNHRVVSALVEFERGTTVTASIHFELASRVESIYINPGARVPAVQWLEPGGLVLDDAKGRRVNLDSSSD